MKVVVRARSAAPPERVWQLLAEPGQWHRWAPHVRGAWRLGSPVVVAGRTGAARLLGVVPVPARITEVDPGRSWAWQVAPQITIDHRVEAAGSGSEIVFEIDGPPPIPTLYGPVMSLVARRLARIA